MKLEITGILEDIGEIRQYPNSRVRQIIIHKPKVYDATRGINYKAQYYPVSIFNDNVDKINREWIDQLVKVEVFVNGHRFPDRETGEARYNIQMNLVNITLC
jgi:hypothetical protein